MKYTIALALLAACSTPTQPIPFDVTVINHTDRTAFVIFTDGFTRTVTDTLRFTLDTPERIRIYHNDDTTHITVTKTTTINLPLEVRL